MLGKSLNDFNHSKLLIYEIIFLFLECLKVIDYFIIFVEFFKTFGRYFWILKYSSHVRSICINLKYEKNREYYIILLDIVFIYLYVEFLGDKIFLLPDSNNSKLLF